MGQEVSDPVRAEGFHCDSAAVIPVNVPWKGERSYEREHSPHELHILQQRQKTGKPCRNHSEEILWQFPF